jgi:hypothetical protein
MKLGFVIPIVGPAVSDAPALSAFCRGLEDLGYDTLWVGDRLLTPVDLDSSYLARGPQMTRSLDPVLLWTVTAATTRRMRLNASTLSTARRGDPRFTTYPTIAKYNTAHPDAAMPGNLNALRSYTVADAGLVDDLTASERKHTLDFLPALPEAG